ncbi:MAG: tripartite tricarboxylate transporter permease [Vicinamibacterales bacterium]
MWEHLWSGFGIASAPINLAFGFIGVVLGTAVGVLPGLGPAAAVSLLLPVTFGLEPTTAFILFGGIYYGSMYGGSTTSILINTPGDASAAVTTLDGFQMARRGRAGAALATAAIGSFIAGTFATAMLMWLAPFFVELALRFGPAEYFTLMVLALVGVGSVSGESPPKAALAVFLGLGLALIGIDLQTGTSRLTFGVPELAGGINTVLGAIGLFAVGEVLWASGQPRLPDSDVLTPTGGLMMTRSEWQRSWPAWIRGSLIGFGIGVLPGAGGTLATFASYASERAIAKQPETFGQGAIEGVAGPEAANNASAGGSLVPLLGLGIPGSGTTAVMLAAFQLYGLAPGPLLFDEQPDLVWGLIASLYIGNVLLLVLNLPLVGLWVKLLMVPKPLLLAAVAMFSTLGAYSLNGSISDVLIAYGLGLLAVVLRRHAVPLAPVLLGLVLGPLLEQELRRALVISSGDWTVFFRRPLSASFLVAAAIAAATPMLLRIVTGRSVPRTDTNP